MNLRNIRSHAVNSLYVSVELVHVVFTKFNQLKNSKGDITVNKILQILLVLLSSLIIFSCKDNSAGASAPSAPTGIQVSQNSEDAISVSWNAVSGASGYNVYRLNGSSWENVGRTSSTSWTDQSVQVAAWYMYNVTALSSAGESGHSSALSGFRKGWRFDNVSLVSAPLGWELTYDLYAFGYNGSPSVCAIIAVFQNGTSYTIVPGISNDPFGQVCALKTYTPAEIAWEVQHDYLSLARSWWNPSYQNNAQPQSLVLKIYRSSTISSLNDPAFNTSAFFSISWNAVAGEIKPAGITKLSPEDREKLIRGLNNGNNPQKAIFAEGNNRN